MITVEWFWQGKRKSYAARVMTVVSVYVFVKYVLTLVMPFFLAFCILSLMQAVLRRLEVHFPMKRRVIAVLLLAAFLLLAGVGMWYLADRIGGQLAMLPGYLERCREEMSSFLHACCQRAEQYTGFYAGSMEETVLLHVRSAVEDMKQSALPKLMDRSVLYVQLFVRAAGFLGMTLIAAILLGKDFRKIQADLQKYKWYQAAEEIGGAIGKLTGDYLKAQLKILCLIGGCCVLVLGLFGIRGSVWIGLLAGVLDALPFIGTGIVLIPTALWQFVQGKVWKGIVTLMLYGACVLLRELAEPRLIGRQMDIYPVVVLLSIYLGIRLYGLSGVVAGPLSFLLIREIWRKIPDFCGDD